MVPARSLAPCSRRRKSAGRSQSARILSACICRIVTSSGSAWTCVARGATFPRSTRLRSKTGTHTVSRPTLHVFLPLVRKAETVCVPFLLDVGQPSLLRKVLPIRLDLGDADHLSPAGVV